MTPTKYLRQEILPVVEQDERQFVEDLANFLDNDDVKTMEAGFSAVVYMLVKMRDEMELMKGFRH